MKHEGFQWPMNYFPIEDSLSLARVTIVESESIVNCALALKQPANLKLVIISEPSSSKGVVIEILI